jgi:hypothetical protein
VAASGTGPTASTETHSVCHRYDTCGTLVINATAEQYVSEMAFQINSDPSVSVTSFYDGTDDGSWQVVSVTECTSPSPTIVATLETTPKTCLTFKMVDSFGDGWSGATYYWQNTDTGEAVGTGTLTGTGYGTDQFCYNDVGECYVLAVTADTYPSEVSWSLELPDGTVWLTGGASTTNYMCAPTLSPTMSPVPTISKMPSSVPTKSETPLPTTPGVCHTLNLYDSWGDGWNGAAWTWINLDRGVTLSTGTHSSGGSSTNTAPICTYDSSDCYTLVVSVGATTIILPGYRRATAMQ